MSLSPSFALPQCILVPQVHQAFTHLSAFAYAVLCAQNAPIPTFPLVLCCHPSVRAWSEFLSAPLFWCPICVCVAGNFVSHLFFCLLIYNLFPLLDQSYMRAHTCLAHTVVSSVLLLHSRCSISKYLLGLCVAREQGNILESTFANLSHLFQGAVVGMILRRIIEWKVRKGAPFKPHLIIRDVKMWKKYIS